MAGGLRFRAEAPPAAIKSFPVGSTVFVPTSALTGIQRAGIYRVALSAGATAATVQFQDTNNGVLSGVYNIGVNSTLTLNMNFNGDPLWQAAIGLGLQAVVTGATVTGDIWTALGA